MQIQGYLNFVFLTTWVLIIYGYYNIDYLDFNSHYFIFKCNFKNMICNELFLNKFNIFAYLFN